MGMLDELAAVSKAGCMLVSVVAEGWDRRRAPHITGVGRPSARISAG